ncbi:MAG: family insertion sequence element accessory protein TnpB [Pseudomonadota bacterium]|jgi:transposase
MIRLDALWLATAPLDMRAGADTALARVVQVFGAARPHHGYVFANRRRDRIKILAHDGIGVWLVARRLNRGHFIWTNSLETSVPINSGQFSALVIGLPWQRIGDAGIIRNI